MSHGFKYCGITAVPDLIGWKELDLAAACPGAKPRHTVSALIKVRSSATGVYCFVPLLMCSVM